MSAPQGQELVNIYRKNFSISADYPLTEEMCQFHWKLERQLTLELLQSTPDNRWETFERCYTRLYKELPWLYSGQQKKLTPAELQAKHGYWAFWLGPPPQKVYEIGSGRAELITCLAQLGYECRATEVTRERGQKYVEETPNLTWGTTDGIHLAQFEPPESYDAVISDQVVEHLHPDDLLEHLRGARALLKPGGKYIFRTPHVHDGPSDISRFFGCDTPQGMHLREYTYGELTRRMKQAGFRNIRSWSPRSRWIYPLAAKMVGAGGVNRAYLNYQRVLERLIFLVPSQAGRRWAAHAGPRAWRFEPSIVMIGDK